MAKRDIPLADKIAYYLLKEVNRAIRDFRMIEDGDRIAVGVSGGKDSVALLHLLRARLHSSPEKYELVAVHVLIDTQDAAGCSEPETRRRLAAWLNAQHETCEMESIEGGKDLDCFRCSTLRRHALFAAAERLGCNKIALGHHRDDAAQTTLLNLVTSGRTETLLPRRDFFGGRFSLIRPLIYVPEKDIVRLVRALDVPLAPSCPRSTLSGRAIAQDAIRLLERAYPNVRTNLLRAGLRGSPRRPDRENESARHT